jgi:hypothetical protein
MRGLTPGEIALVQSVFGDQVDYRKIRVTNKKVIPFFQGKDCAAARGNRLSFPALNYSDDFSLEKDPRKQSVFIHEMVHVWQHQNGLFLAWLAIKENLRCAFNYQSTYRYNLDPDKPLGKYNFEQQAAIVQDYFLLIRHGVAQSYKNRRMSKNDDLATDYSKTIGTALPITRLHGFSADDKPSGPAPAA